MISARFIASVLLGLFSFALGCLALARDRRPRLNRFFAFYSFVVAAWCIAPGFLIDFLPHGPALFFYRVLQIALPLHAYFFMCFIQEFAGVYDEPSARRVRAITFVCIVVLAPFYPTSLVMRDFVKGPTEFKRLVGPLYLPNILLFLTLFLAAFGITLRNLIGSAGVKRNQMKFMFAGVVLAIAAIVAYFLSFISRSFSLIHFFVQIAANFCFAYTIFKYRLFDFGVVLRRVSIYAGVYLVLLSLPLFLYFPLRGFLEAPGTTFWLRLSAVTIVYGVLFSLAPFLTSYLRHKSEEKRWSHLREQLDFLRESSETLADETGAAPQEIASRISDVLKELYTRRLKTPLTFVFAAIKAPDGTIATSSSRQLGVESDVLVEFLDQLSSLPTQMLQLPFGERDIDERFVNVGQPAVLKRYLKANGIEICCPCVHDGKLHGALLLGPKHSGIFGAEELATLQMAAGYVATAVRKSELIARTRELHTLDQMKQDLISNITHEFKLPLANVETAAAILTDKIKRGEMAEEALAEFVGMIRTNSARLGFYIQDLLSVARIDQARVDLDLERVDLKRLVENVAADVAAMARQKGLNLDVSAPEGIVLPLDLEKMRQVVNNLATNAVKFTDEGKVSIRVEQREKAARIVVEDTGRGIDAAYLTSVFEKFFRTPDPQNRRTKGTGLGLAIAKGWVEAHGGRIWAESGGVGKGTRFIVELAAF